MGSLIDFLTARGVAEQVAKPLAFLLLAGAMGALTASAKYGYDQAVTRTQFGSTDAALPEARAPVVVSNPSES